MGRLNMSPPEPYKAAREVIDSMRLNTFFKMVDINFTLEDVIDWCVDKDIKKLLMDAHKVTYADNFWGSAGSVHIGGEMSLAIRYKEAGMFVPGDGYAKPGNGPDPKGIMAACLETLAIRDKFAKVQWVIDWLNLKQVTPGAARYYWPTILSLLPETHAVHKSDGQRYREPAGISEVIELMRETSAIVASALILGDVPRPPRHSRVTLVIQSNAFPLV